MVVAFPAATGAAGGGVPLLSFGPGVASGGPGRPALWGWGGVLLIRRVARSLLGGALASATWALWKRFLQPRPRSPPRLFDGTGRAALGSIDNRASRRARRHEQGGRWGEPP